ncbi:hypothetical protein T10_4230 [Trichinella papuae]|uniref:Uncharacterized protein n=1 Tax=Trichinella papuae TaxID=268474 RepID=A0A0V1M2S3_9BILA|nr:hypothetical protein T10_4230 [Trichinella papuae]
MLYYKNRKSHDTTGDMRSPFLSINVDSCGGTGIWDRGVGAVVLKQPCVRRSTGEQSKQTYD